MTRTLCALLKGHEGQCPPHVLVKGMRTEIRPEVGEGPCCPGRHTHTRNLSFHHLATHSLRSPGKGKQGPKHSFFQRGHWKKPTQKVGHHHLGVGAVRISCGLRLKNIWWDLLPTNQTIKPFPELLRPPPNGTGGPSRLRCSPPSRCQRQLGQGLASGTCSSV